MSKIDIVCVYNDEDLYNQMVESTRGCQDLCINIIGLDNRNGEFKSAAIAYNFAIEKLCKSQVLVFCHQDIIWSPQAIRKIYEICIEDNNTLYGAAGVLNKGWRASTVSAITDPYAKYGLEENKIINVFTLDELMVTGNSEIFDKLKFDPVTCFSWDFYAVDLCLQCHLKK